METPLLTPASLEAEQAVLGALLIEPAALLTLDLAAEEFFYRKNQLIYDAMLALGNQGRQIDTTTVSLALERHGNASEVGGLAYLVELVNTPAFFGNIEHYAKEIRRTANLRRLLSAATRITEQAMEPNANEAEVIADSLALLTEIANGNPSQEAVSLKQAIGEAIWDLSTIRAGAKEPGLPLGLLGLDEIIGGLEPGNLVVVAARPGVGKSSLALQMAYNVSLAQKQVLFFSIEMSQRELVYKVLAMSTGADSHAIRKASVDADAWQRILAAEQFHAQTGLYLEDNSALKPAGMLAQAAKHKARSGLDLVVIDYLQIMTPDSTSNNRVNEVSAMTRALKLMAKTLGVPVIVLSQLNRAVENREGGKPQLSDLRESGSIEQDADIVMFISRNQENPDIAEVTIAKHRAGRCGNVAFFFDGPTQTFKELEKIDAQVLTP